MSNADNERDVDPVEPVPDAGTELSGEEPSDVEEHGELGVHQDVFSATDLAAQLNFGEGLFQHLTRRDEEVEIVPSSDGPPAAIKAGDDIGEHLEELADDMLALMRRVRAIEETQQALLARMDQVNDGWAKAARSIAREVDTLRRDIVGERSHVAASGVFNELIPMIENLRTMRRHLDDDKDTRMISQLDGVLETLASCLRRLGCQEFEAEIGSPFDPSRMECAERLADGELGVVLESSRSGYRFGDCVLRPVLVKLGVSPTTKKANGGDDLDE